MSILPRAMEFAFPRTEGKPPPKLITPNERSSYAWNQRNHFGGDWRSNRFGCPLQTWGRRPSPQLIVEFSAQHVQRECAWLPGDRGFGRAGRTSRFVVSANAVVFAHRFAGRFHHIFRVRLRNDLPDPPR